MEGFHTRERHVAGLYYPERDLRVAVWAGRDGAFSFHLVYQGAFVDVQTTRAGVEAVRDACNDALVRTDD